MSPLAEPAARTREAAADVVADQLRQRIYAGNFAIGQRLIESDLTREMGVSRHTVRAALAKLENEGLVEISLNRGASIRRLSRREVAEIFDLRAVLDGHAARNAAEHVDVGNYREQVDRAIGIWQSAVVLTDPGIHNEKNAELHRLIFEMSGNRRLPEVVRQLQIPGYRMRFRLLLSPERLAKSAADHVAIMSAIRAGNGRTAETLARSHSQWSGRLLQTLPDTDFDG